MYLYFNNQMKDESNGHFEHHILAERRKELKMTQQQVAEKAGMQIRQYQRLENGERNITGSTGRVLLSVCDVLKLDPYILIGSGNKPPEVKYIVLPPIEIQGFEYVIPSLAYYTLVSNIPKGMVCSDNDIMTCLRKAYGMENLEIQTDQNSAEMHIQECFPFWRVVSQRGYLVNHFYCSKEKQRDYLEKEGINILPIGENESYRIDDYEYIKFDIHNLKITVLKTEKQIIKQYNKLNNSEDNQYGFGKN